MNAAAIDNPIINSAFDPPTKHHRTTRHGITPEIVQGRRASVYFVPVPDAKKKSAQPLLFEEEPRENQLIEAIRGRVALWRDRDYPGVTPITRHLLEFWKNPQRERRLFFCQIEALETAIFLTEFGRDDQFDFHRELKDAAAKSGTPLSRIAFKMATGSGKTVVMAMLIAWQTLNKRNSPQDKRFTDSFLVVTPGITVRDRLRVLLPSDPANVYQALELVSDEYLQDIGAAKIVITNYHAFKPKDTGDAGGLTKAILAGGKRNPFIETAGEVVRRVCRELGAKREIIVFNDEAHHCYRSKPGGADEKLTGDDRRDAAEREEAARLWISGLEAVHAKLGIKTVFDLSATPFYLQGSGYPSNTLFPWVVSDFSLIDAIECGIVKIPRVPIADDTMKGEMPVFRDLWPHVRDDLPRKPRTSEDNAAGPPQIPMKLQAALESLYGHYKKVFDEWMRHDPNRPPVFIVVCHNTSVSKLVFDYIAGFETGKEHPDGAAYVAPGRLALFSNVEHNRWLHRPRTILVDSRQFESDEGMSPEFKKLAAAQIEEFKADYRERFPGRDVDSITDVDLMREVLNTVGKPGKLGESIRCIVSVSMLTEGWDATTVTHILGVRAFGSQLLSEQVIGRALRRASYELTADGMFPAEYADVYGVPFKFIPCAGGGGEALPPPPTTRVEYIAERVERNPVLDITFPRVTGYRYELTPQRLDVRFDSTTRLTLSPEDCPTEVESAPILGQIAIHNLEGLKARRPQEIAFHLARFTLDKFFPAAPGGPEDVSQAQVWLFPQLLGIASRWFAECVDLKDHAFPQLLLFTQNANLAAEKIQRAIVQSLPGERRLRPALVPYDDTGNARGIRFDTRRDTFTTKPEKCPVNYVPLDSDWEAKLAQTIESIDPVKAYVKNAKLGFKIPFTFNGLSRYYEPDYILRVDDGTDDLLNLIVEVSGQPGELKAAKVATAKTLWVPAINAEGRFGRWAFLEITDPWKAEDKLAAFFGR